MLSVIVTSCDAPDLLERCLAALVTPRRTEDVEVIVADCSRENPTPRLAARFPTVRVRHVEPMSLPALRWTAVRDARGDLIGAVEARCTPAEDWCEAIVRAHRAAPDAPAVGGPVDLKAGANAFDWGLYLCEYVAFAPPVEEADAEEISGANLSYKRADLEAARDVLDEGVWEAALHLRWRRAGRRMRMSRATVVFQNGMRPAAAVRMRFNYARSYAAERIRGDLGRRILYALGSPALPFVLTTRVARHACRKGYGPAFWRALPWILVLNSAWSAGEFAGYATGLPGKPSVF
jgi:glycosyl transferase family 2